MVMDYVRTPYRRKCRLFRDSDIEVTLRWYPAPPGAKLFPGYHLFASGDWSPKDVAWEGPGEVRTDGRHWQPAGKPTDYQGCCFAGKLEWFQNGPSLSDFDPNAVLPDCCKKARQLPGIGFGAGYKTLPIQGTAGVRWGSLPFVKQPPVKVKGSGLAFGPAARVSTRFGIAWGSRVIFPPPPHRAGLAFGSRGIFCVQPFSLFPNNGTDFTLPTRLYCKVHVEFSPSIQPLAQGNYWQVVDWHGCARSWFTSPVFPGMFLLQFTVAQNGSGGMIVVALSEVIPEVNANARVPDSLHPFHLTVDLSSIIGFSHPFAPGATLEISESPIP